ncbi:MULTISPECIES: TetR/AcrR family transcriptional regulator [unclassified Brevibacterium]|uniref:TetR/AcrR family transcriptional regulator n=1 Tax=unclassified Brevibacterium TaxID=2614124 RepID=UPI0010932CEB|nr:TetR/AcrR family transcriptional regulator [Brevibacterium sp. S22]TGD32536.1 TetR/AcrR family transcriptional regulator [Brevibacterium sp. S22]
MDEITGPQSAYGRGNEKALPLVPSQAPLRADAQRNRQKVLDAAADILAAQGVDGLTMDELARSAGVGKGTLYRNFTDKAGIASALLDDRVRDMHARMLQGPPPLGPGTSGRERLRAFVAAYLDHIARNLDLVLLTESSSPKGRFDRQSYPFWRRHVEILITDIWTNGTPEPADANSPEPDLIRTRAEAILSVLSAAQIDQWLHRQGRALDELIPQLQTIVTAIASRQGPTRRLLHHCDNI